MLPASVKKNPITYEKINNVAIDEGAIRSSIGGGRRVTR